MNKFKLGDKVFFKSKHANSPLTFDLHGIFLSYIKRGHFSCLQTTEEVSDDAIIYVFGNVSTTKCKTARLMRSAK